MSVTVYRLWEWKGVPIPVWPHALKRGSSAALLLRLRVWIPPGGSEVYWCWNFLFLLSIAELLIIQFTRYN